MKTSVMQDTHGPLNMDSQNIDSPSALIELEIEHDAWAEIKGVSDICMKAAKSALAVDLADIDGVELFIRLTDNQTSKNLNGEYRGKDRPTNVLSFPGLSPDDIAGALRLAAHKKGPPVHLGDLVVAFGVVRQEARSQKKELAAHLSHLIVHGVLHLLGYDHINDDEANCMEQLEAQVMAGLGYNNPYDQYPFDETDTLDTKVAGTKS